MSLLPDISWEVTVREVAVHSTPFNYTCKVEAENPNNPGYNQLSIGYYLIDFAGNVFEVMEIINASTNEIRVYDVYERSIGVGPYVNRTGYIYEAKNDAIILTQAQLRRLDESAPDNIQPVEKGIIWANRGVDLDGTINTTKINTSNGIESTIGDVGWVGGKELTIGVTGEVGPVDSIQYNTSFNPSTEPEGLSWWNEEYNTLNLSTGYGSTLQVGQEIHIKVYNDNAFSIPAGSAVYPTGAFDHYPTIGLASTATHENVSADYGMTTTTMGPSEYGMVTWFGKVHSIDTSGLNMGDILWISPNNPGEFVTVKPEFPNYAIQLGIVFKIDASDGEVFVTGKDSVNDTFQNFWNGTFRETIDFLVTSDGTTITGTLSPSNGHPDMTMIFSDGFTMLDTSPPVTITLTPGTDTNPQDNYVYIPKSTKVLTVSTSDWPVSVEHIKVAHIAVKSALTTQTEGALRNQNWNDAVQSTHTNQGHLTHITERLRQEPSKWHSGVEASVTINTGSIPDDVYISTTAGQVYQLHRQTFPSQDMAMGNDLHIVNDFTTPYKTTTNLNTETVSAKGSTLSNSSFSMVLWGIQNKSGEMSHLMLNLPTGTYAKNAPDDAVSDANNYSVYTIPRQFQGVGFLIARFTFVLQTGGLSWSLYDTEDLRGKSPNTTAGGGGGGTGGGVTTYLGLTDTDSSYATHAGKVPSVNIAETGLEFNTIGSLYTETDPTVSSFTKGLIDNNSILNAVKAVDGSGSNLDADLLDGQQGSYYLNYNNFTNTPTLGEINTASNLGTGEGLFTTKSGVNLPFKSIVAGTNVTLSSDANTVTINATGGGTSNTFSNGLTESSGAVTLGGVLTQNTFITGTSHSFNFGTGSTDGIGSFTVFAGTNNGGFIGVLDSGFIANIRNSTGTSVGHTNNFRTNSTTIQMENHATGKLEITNEVARFTDVRTSGNRKGIEYDGDYSGDYTNRSLVDKAYVDGHPPYYEKSVDNDGIETFNYNDGPRQYMDYSTGTVNYTVEVSNVPTTGAGKMEIILSNNILRSVTIGTSLGSQANGFASTESGEFHTIILEWVGTVKWWRRFY